MATPSTETFQRYKFHQLYPNVLDSEVILAPFNHGRHWCLVLVNLKEKMSVYIDSLYDGAGANMAFTRLNNFLTCFASLKEQTWNLHNWRYFAIPSSEISQQINSDDCGVFVAKWAQHISLGLPLDFTQDQMVTFRYSLILDIKRNSLSLEIKAPNAIHKEILGTNMTKPTLHTAKRSKTLKPAPYKKPTGTGSSSKQATPTQQTSVSGKTPTGAYTSSKQATPAQQTSVSGKTPTGTYTSSKQATPAQQTSVSGKTPTGTHTSSKQATPSQQTSVSGIYIYQLVHIPQASKQATPAQQTSVSGKTPTGTYTSSKQATPAQQTSVSGKTPTGAYTSRKQATPAQQTFVSSQTPTGRHTSSKQATQAHQTSVPNKTLTVTSQNPASTTATGLKQPNLQSMIMNPPTLAASQTSIYELKIILILMLSHLKGEDLTKQFYLPLLLPFYHKTITINAWNLKICQ